MNIYLLLSQTKKNLQTEKANCKNNIKLQSEKHLQKRERERESIWKQKFANTGGGEDISLKGGVERQNSPITRNLK